MKRRVLLLGTALLIAAGPGSPLSAQLWEAAPLGEDLLTFSLHGGMVAPTTTLPDGSSHAEGAALGASAAVWPTRYVGVRASFTSSHTEGIHGPTFSAAAAHDPTVWLYSAELALRLPLRTGRLAWAPYLSGGPGAKSYRWSIDRPRVGDTAFAWSYGGGLDLRPTSRVGLVIDARTYRSRYMWHGLGLRATVPDYEAYGPMLNDFVFTAGVSLNR